MTETAAAPVRLSPGDPAPDFTLPDADGNLVAGCTTQAVDFTEAAGDLAQAGLDIIGVSPDEPEKLLKFREQESLGITLVSDPDNRSVVFLVVAMPITKGR